MGVTARRKRLRPDQNDFKAGAKLIEQGSIVALLLIKGLEETGRPLKNFTSSRKLRCRKQSCNHAALRCEADAQSFGQGWSNRAVARNGGTAKGDAQRIVQPVFVQIENLAARGGSREGSQCDGASVNRFGISH